MSPHSGALRCDITTFAIIKNAPPRRAARSGAYPSVMRLETRQLRTDRDPHFLHDGFSYTASKRVNKATFSRDVSNLELSTHNRERYPL